ncbi:hypothetical protein [Acidovorax sp.]|uniref:hypothetical protein n=1 Tax=Acidovorax sp. TaxID=1872122 RepID=UPI00391F3C16
MSKRAMALAGGNGWRTPLMQGARSPRSFVSIDDLDFIATVNEAEEDFAGYQSAACLSA